MIKDKVINKWYIRLPSLISCFLFFLGCTQATLPEETEKTAELLLKDAIKMKHQAFILEGNNQRVKINEAIEAFNGVCEKADTTSLNCAKAQLQVASLYDILGEQKKALSQYNSILKKYPENDLKFRKALALSKKAIALIFWEQKKYIQAQEEFKSIVVDYSDQRKIANNAKEKINEIYAFLKNTSTDYSILAESKSIGNEVFISSDDIYFEFDESTLSPSAQDSLMMKVAWLRANPDIEVTVEGHVVGP